VQVQNGNNSTHPAVPSTVITVSWDLDIRNLQAMLKELETHPDGIKDIRSGIHAWRLQTHPPAMLTHAGQKQANLSWDNFVHGFLPTPILVHNANAIYKQKSLTNPHTNGVLLYYNKYSRLQEDNGITGMKC